MPSLFTGSGLVRFLARFVLVYCIALLVDWHSPVAGYVTRATVLTSTQLLSAAGDAPITRRFTFHETGEIHVDVSAGQFEKTYDLQPLYRNNVYIFFALVIACSGLSWRQRFAGLTVGGVGLLSVNALVFLGAMWEFEMRYPQLNDLLPRGAFRFLAGLAYQLSPTGGVYMLPIFLWGLVLLSPMATRRVAVTQKVARNEPCPCGSGRKYKTCCGA